MASKDDTHLISDSIPIEQGDEYNRVFSPSSLQIEWSHDDRYWQQPLHPSSSPAKLKQVSWLEVTVAAEEVPAGRTYEVGFGVSLEADAFGWKGIPIYLMAKVGKKGKYKWKAIYLEGEATETEFNIPRDGLCIQVTATQQPLVFGLYEVWTGKWKGGLKIHSAFIKEVKETTSPTHFYN